MATTVLKRGIILFFTLSFHLPTATCALLNRNQQNAEAQCASNAIFTTFKAHSNARSFCSAYLAGAPAIGAVLSVSHLYAKKFKVNSIQKAFTNNVKTTTVVVADTTITTEETVSPTLYIYKTTDYGCTSTKIPH